MDKTQTLSEKLSSVIIEEDPPLLELYQAVTVILIAFTPRDLHHLAEPFLDAIKKSVLDGIAIGEE